MAFLPNRDAPLPASTVAAYNRWLGSLDEELSDPACDRYQLCERVLMEIYFPQYIGVDPATLPEATRLALLQTDARNATREPEYYGEIDREKYGRVKPLLWLWEMFDNSALGENVHLGVLFRRLLAKRIFRSCGKNFKAFRQVKFSYGYNMEVGDNVVVHRQVLLDDRGGIQIGNSVSISDFANVYSHSHHIVEGREVATPITTIGDGCRITYHATVMSGVNIAPNTMVGGFAMATRDTLPDSVYIGIPAKRIRDKPQMERRPPTPDSLATE
jgi:acetyltransferase-like isoleucine patch superfamily enzyme